MHIGIVIKSDLKEGGAHSFEGSFRRIVTEACERQGHTITTFATHLSGDLVPPAIKYRLSPARMAMSHLRSNPLALAVLRLIGCGKSNLDRLASKHGVDLLVFASPNHLSLGLQHTPFSTTVWDFGHLDLPQASETSMSGLWAWREELYQRSLRRSLAVFCDSESTARRLNSEYKVNHDRIHAVGLLPRVGESRQRGYELPYFIYPAMFWPHKNHAMLVRAFAEFVKAEGPVAYLIFTGVGAEFTKVKDLAATLGVSDQIKFEGLVSRVTLEGLVRGSRGVLMPSLLGPSNLPPLEAALVGVPSVMSSAHDMEDLLVGGTYVESHDQSAWTRALSLLFQNKVPVARLAKIDELEVVENAIQLMARDIAPWERF